MVYYWLTRSVNADIGGACWRRGAFVDFFCDGLGRDVARYARYMGYGGEFWERVHVLNRLVRDMLGRRDENRALFPRYFARYIG